jgi:hypothetical protein
VVLVGGVESIHERDEVIATLRVRGIRHAASSGSVARGDGRSSNVDILERSSLGL